MQRQAQVNLGEQTDTHTCFVSYTVIKDKQDDRWQSNKCQE